MSAYLSRGVWFSKVSVGPKDRRTVKLAGAVDETDARRRDVLLVELVRALRKAKQADFIDLTIANVSTWPSEKLDGVRTYVIEKLCSGDYAPRGKAASLSLHKTFDDVGRLWTSGELAKAWPDHVQKKKSTYDDEKRLHKLKASIGSVPIGSFTLAHYEHAMAELPRGIGASTRRHYAGLISRVLTLAVYPLRLLAAHPIPKGALPRRSAEKARSAIYPGEHRQLLACAEVPIGYRMAYGFLAREGMRSESEAAAMSWADLDLERGAVRLDANKTDDPRAWALDPSTVRALKWWRETHRKKAKLTDPVLTHASGERLNWGHLAEQVRAHLKLAKVDRPELFESTATRMQLRAHDAGRATFITIALANGRTESWVMDRTGHKSSSMINRYRRAARRFEELALGPLAPMDECLPEMSKVSAKGA